MFSVDVIEKKNNSKYANIHKTNFCCLVGKILANKNLSNIYIYIHTYIYIYARKTNLFWSRVLTNVGL